MRIAVAGTGYVGLVTGVALAEIGHNVTCVDVNEDKINKMKKGISPIYEVGLEELMRKNKTRIDYTIDYRKAYKNAEVIFIGVGTPEREDGSANLDYVYSVCKQIADSIANDCVVVVKSTVPIGTNDDVEKYLRENVKKNLNVYVVSNPEFLAQGTAVHDTLYASRIVVGTEDEYPKEVMKKLYEPLTKKPYNVPYLSMNRRSAEMVKYASNDFLALKISYINEISNFCEKVGANIVDVTLGMSKDSRIGSKFLNSGIGYGGSCFPKDTKALHWLSKDVDSEIKTIKACIEVNKEQKIKLFTKLKGEVKDLYGLRVAVLGCSFKPGTDDLREAPSIDNVKLLLNYGVKVNVYDPLKLSLESFKKLFNNDLSYFSNIDDCIKGTDCVMIMTEHKEIKEYNISNYVKLMSNPVIYDGRNCYSVSEMNKYKVKYVSMGRKVIDNLDK
jgi:UDPglucose 6-dehydrogenase